MAASRHAYLGVERILMADRLIHVLAHAMLSLASMNGTGAAIAGAACCASIGGALIASVAYADEGPAPQPVTALHCGYFIGGNR